MINVATIGVVKNWPLIAENGFVSVFFLLIAALLFFIPVALVSAELATGWPERGGVFLWVKEAFGHRAGFLAIWLQWIQNVVWYPTVLSFIASTLAYAFEPTLAENKLYALCVMLILFWLATFANLQGMRFSGWISSAGTVFGSFLPAFLIIGLGISWIALGNPLQLSFTTGSFIPDFSSIAQLVFFTGVVLSLMGMEMSAVHVREVQNPQKTFPRAMAVSILIILGLSIPGVLAISMVVPQKEISLLSGSIQAFTHFVNAFGLSWLTPLIAVLIAVGAIASMSTWLVGPSKGLLTAAEAGELPPLFRRQNKHGMPIGLLFVQAAIVSLLTILFLLMPTLNAAFWFISAIVAELYLLMYLLLFASAIKLRYKSPHVVRHYKVPGGKVGIWIVCGIGTLVSLFAFFVGFFPPAQIPVGSSSYYVFSLLGGVILFCLGPSIILLFKRPSWNK